MDVASSHPISIIVNALGVPPEYMVEGSRRHCRCFDGCKRTRNQGRRGGRRCFDLLRHGSGRTLRGSVDNAVDPGGRSRHGAYPNEQNLSAKGIVTGR